VSDDAAINVVLRRLLDEREARAVEAERPGISAFRWVCGGLCAIISLVFLTVNTIMLGRFGMRMGADETEQWSQAVIAGTIPWVLALLPFILLSTWVPARIVLDRRGRPKRKRGRPSFATLSAASLYVVVVAVNFIGGIGVMAVARQQVAGKAKDAGREEKLLSERRADLQKQLDSIGGYRPTEEVENLIKRQQQHPFWARTNQCSSDGGAITNRAQRNFCAELDTLRAEVARGKKGDSVREQIASVDTSLASPVRSQVMADDAQAAVLAYNLGIDETKIRFMMPLMWPVLLELGSMLLAYFALKMFRVDHTTLVDMPADSHRYVPPSRQLPPPAQPSRVRRALDVLEREDTAPRPLVAHPVPPSSEDPILQRSVFDAFWATRVRKAEGGQMPEQSVFNHYQALCAQRLVAPYDLPTFRRLSGGIVGDAVVEMSGVRWYCGLTVTDV